MGLLLKNLSKFRDVQCLCQAVMVLSCDCQAVVSRRHKMTFMLLKTISFFFFSYLPLKECYFIFKSSFQTKRAPLYQAVHSTIILRLHLIFLWFQLVYSDAAEKGISGISQIYFQVSVLKKSVLTRNFECTMAIGNAPLASYALLTYLLPVWVVWGFGGGWVGWGGGVCLMSVLLALLFILVTSIRICHSVVLFLLVLLNRHTTW